MRLSITIMMLLFFCTALFGETKVDSLVKLKKQIDEDNQYLIYDYRLPAWGYHQLLINFGSSTSGFNLSGSQMKDERKQHNLNLTPAFRWYRESEKLDFLIQSFLYSNVNYRKDEFKNNFQTEKQKQTRFDTQFSLTGDFRHYIIKKIFLRYGLDKILRYNEQNDERIQINNGFRVIDSEDTDIFREYDTNLQFGIGYGRVRNITPVFRALRFNERLKDIRNFPGVDRSVLEDLADLFTRRPAYNMTYDRPGKYFYSNLPPGLYNQISGFAPWEVLYLTDVWNEIIGERLQGFQVNTGITMDYERNSYSNGISDSERFLLGIYLDEMWYHNLTTRYQIGTRFYTAFSRVLNENTPYNYFGKVNLGLFNLWNLTDRLLAEWALGAYIAYAKGETEGFITQEIWERMDNYFTRLTFTYYIQNNLAVDTRISYNYYQNWPANFSFEYDGTYHSNSFYNDERYWSISVNLIYYFIRGIY